MDVKSLRSGLEVVKSKVQGFQNAGLFQKQLMAEAAVLEAAALLGLLVAVVEAFDDRLTKLEGMQND